MNDYLKILQYKRVWLNAVLAILSSFGMFYVDILIPITFILASNLYDILGYHFTLIRRTTVMPEKIIIRSYRITQLMFDILLLLLIGVLFNPIISIAAAILKVFGLQDVLYYVFLQKELPEKWTWLRWTPIGFILSPLSKQIVVTQALIGILLALILILI